MEETNAASSAAWTNATAGNTALAVSTVGFGNAAFGFVLTGGVIASGVVQFECTMDGVAWLPLSVEPVSGFTTLITSFSLAAAANIAGQAYVGGFQQVRIRLSTAISNSSGSPVATFWIRPSVSSTQESGLVFQPTGSNLHVVVDTLPSLASGSATIGSVRGIEKDNDTNSVLKIPVIPCTANAAAPSWTEAHEAPLSVDLAGNLRAILNAETTKVIGTINIASAQKIELYDGTNTATVKAASTAPATTDTALVVTQSPVLPLTSKYSQIAVTTTANPAVLVGSVVGQTIRVFRIALVFTSATNISIEDSTPTLFSGAMSMLAGGSIGMDGNGDPLFVTASGKAFQLVNSTGAQVSGTVWYTQS